MVEEANKQPRSEVIEIISSQQNSQHRWTPVEGTEALEFREHLRKHGIGENDRDTVMREAASVLAQCVPPTASSGRETGLVIGYVQSGKTMSFTALAALARDNGYKLIVVISGITTNLFGQSTERLKKDLRIDERQDFKWQFLPNPRPRTEIRQRIESAIRSSTNVPGTISQTVLVTVMKNCTHLNHLIDLMRGIKMDRVPALVIDDEADQASLNNQVRRGTESATYSRIQTLRQLLPHHTFLQYTATPQALLLINLIDTLSPSFVELLTPGPAYTGGRAFFQPELQLTRSIPPEEIPSQNQTLLDVPESLLDAMRSFFIGVAAGLMSGPQGNRSMMVHPSKRTLRHADYFAWVRQIQQHWVKTLDLSDQDPDRQDLLNDFKRSYDDLCETVQGLIPFDELVPYLRAAVRQTIVHEVNARLGRSEQVDWQQNPFHILVGGEKLSRGFTVAGLTVTYMPRGSGVGNADTIEQRARWFGYKSDYLGYCRVFLDDQIRDIYRGYVTQEESIRDELRKFKATGKPLSEWPRRFFIASELQPTRSSVLDLQYARGNFAGRWYEPHWPHESEEMAQWNRRVVEEFLSGLKMAKYKWQDNATEDQTHLRSCVGLRSAYESLLAKLRLGRPADLQSLYGFLLNVDRYIEHHPEEECTVFLMSQGKLRDRSIENATTNKIPHIWGGPTPGRKGYKRGELYPGDTHIREKQGVTIQISILNVTRDRRGKEVIAGNVPAVTAWIPRDTDAHWVAGPGQPLTED